LKKKRNVPNSFSVVVITRDEELNLDRCLRSVAWADEILVVDSGSTDRTLEIAARHEARILCRDWPGYMAQKNFAVEQAHNDWVLSLDADEWLTDEVAEEIRRTLAAPRADAYALRRITAFSGAFLRRTWSPDWQSRLFRKGRASFAGGQVHESLRLADGAVSARLRQPMLHLGYRSIRDYVERMNRYTDLAADTLRQKQRGVPWARLVFSPPATFVKLYLIKGGFLDGLRGLVVAAGSAFYVLLKYAKLWEMRRAPSPEFLSAAGTTPEDGEPGATGDSPHEYKR
jgi:glycosyltransferase involved in cell wall biosynthesis